MTTTPDENKPRWPMTRYRRRTHIPVFDGAQSVGCLIWRNGQGMDAYIADGTPVGRFRSRREAASALWKTYRRRPVAPETLPGYIGPAAIPDNPDRALS
jgi:hypothetical protein